jgi:redox-sensitive bicupin YhaK (pirin superfamily)
MEIISYVLKGALEHKDSLGNGTVIRPGEVQRMSAGTGFVHSEFNPSKTEPLHFMQIWIIPDYTGLPPSYEQKVFPVGERGRMQLVAAPYGGDGAVTLHQDARLFIANLGPGEGADHRIEPGRGIWMQLARGIIALNGTEMREGDGAAVEDEPAIEIEAKNGGRAPSLVFDVA